MFISYKQNFCPAFIQTQAFIFSVHLSGQGQGRMAGTSTSVYKFDRVVRVNYVCKTVWILLIVKMLQVYSANKHNKYAADDWQ